MEYECPKCGGIQITDSYYENYNSFCFHCGNEVLESNQLKNIKEMNKR